MKPSARISAPAAALACAALLATPLPGQDTKTAGAPAEWNQWRGPRRDGSSAEKGWSHRWPAGGSKELWRIKLGPGYSAVSVGHGRLYTNGGTFRDEVVYCLAPDNGEVLWKFPFP